MNETKNMLNTGRILNNTMNEEDDDVKVDSILASFYEKKSLPHTDSVIINDLEKTTVMDKTANIGEPFKPEKDLLEEKNDKKNSIKRKKQLELEKKQKQKQKRIAESKRTFFHVFGSVLLVVFIVSIASFLAYYTVRASLDLTGIVNNEYEVEVEIPNYATTEEIAEILHDNGIVDLAGFFVFYSNLKDADGKYLNGMFTLSSTMSYNQIINSLQSITKKKETVMVRILEGMTAVEIGQLLEENLVCRAADFEYYYKNKLNNYNFEKRILINSMKGFQLEGYLFPDTYEFYVNETLRDKPDLDTSKEAQVVANRIYQNFNSKITKEIYKRTNEIGFTLDEMMTLASMVQAEAATLEDMRLVASVFLNRLNNSGTYPYLQSDVTKIYADENIRPLMNSRNTDLYEPILKAYSTYESEGIPPGPVCNPGMTAIEAVLYAPQTDYYFFCANEETLEIFYATNIWEHEQNLIKAGLTV